MRQEKQLLKQEIINKFAHQPSYVIMQYGKLAANTANEFRRMISKVGGDVEIVRKRILIKAAQELGIELNVDVLEGHIGLIFLGHEPLETTKMVFKFSKDKDKVFKIIAGCFEGQLYNGADVEKLSTLPSMPEMRAQFLGTLEAPMAQTLAVIEALLTSVAHCLENKCQKDGGCAES